MKLVNPEGGLIKTCGHFFSWTDSYHEAFTALLSLQTITWSLTVLIQQTWDLFVNLWRSEDETLTPVKTMSSMWGGGRGGAEVLQRACCSLIRLMGPECIAGLFADTQCVCALFLLLPWLIPSHWGGRGLATLRIIIIGLWTQSFSLLLNRNQMNCVGFITQNLIPAGDEQKLHPWVRDEPNQPTVICSSSSSNESKSSF